MTEKHVGDGLAKNGTTANVTQEFPGGTTQIGRHRCNETVNRNI
jgi:hypothetical protein